MFNDIDTPKIGSKRACGSSPWYKKLFCLHCIVSYSNDSLHICGGRCHCCLGTDEDHVGRDDSREFFATIVVGLFYNNLVMKGTRPRNFMGSTRIIVIFCALFATWDI